MWRIRRMFVFGLGPVLILTCLVFLYGWGTGTSFRLGGADADKIRPPYSLAAAGGAIGLVIAYVAYGGIPTFIVGAFVGLIMAGPKNTDQA